MSNKNLSRRGLLKAGGVAGAGAFAGTALPAMAQDARKKKKSRTLNWRMATSWPENAPGSGALAQSLASRITRMSGGRLTIEVFAAGTLVPAFGVFDAVSSETVEMGHTAPIFWAGKMPAAPLFTAAPFGMTPEAQVAWMIYGGGQALWDELYASFDVKPFMAGNSGFQMGGWYNKQIKSLDDLKGLRIRMPGLGGEVMRLLGAAPVSLPPGEIFAALKSGAVDAAEFLGPWADKGFGLDKAAKYYYWPGWHEPNGAAECLISTKAWESLDEDLKAIVEAACAAENQRGLAEADWYNAVFLEELEKQGVALKAFPEDVLKAARTASVQVLDDLAVTSDIAGRIVDSYRGARDQMLNWAEISRFALMKAQFDI